MARRRFQTPDSAPPRDPYGLWAATVAVLLLAWVVFVVLVAGHV